MNTFAGNIEAKIDDKGRIFIPATYRKILQEMGSKHIIMRRDDDNDCLIFYPEHIWQAKVNTLKSVLDEWDANDELLLMQYMADAEVLDTDTQGRVLLQKKTLEAIEAKQEILFVGMLDRFALWAPDKFAATKTTRKALADKIREKMKAAQQDK